MRFPIVCVLRALFRSLDDNSRANNTAVIIYIWSSRCSCSLLRSFELLPIFYRYNLLNSSAILQYLYKIQVPYFDSIFCSEETYGSHCAYWFRFSNSSHALFRTNTDSFGIKWEFVSYKIETRKVAEFR